MTTLFASLTLLFQFMLGFGIVAFFGLAFNRTQKIALSMITGLASSTVLLFLLECLHIPLKEVIFLPLLGAVAVGIQFAKKHFLQDWKNLFRIGKINIQLHEVVLLILIALRLGVAVWRAYYQPIIARDNMVGMDLAARYAVHDGHFVSGLFTSPYTASELSNQPYYAPFTSFSLVIYRLTGMTFGSLWLAPLTLSFCALLYSQIKRFSHPLLAGLSLLLFLAAPEVFSYTFLVLTDFPNMVFFVTSLMLLMTAAVAEEKLRLRHWALASLMMGFACWSRSDTAIYVILLTGLLPVLYWKTGIRKMWKPILLFAGTSFLFFAAWSLFFVPFYFPSPPVYDMYPDLANTQRFITNISDLVSKVMFHPQAFGFFFWIAIPYMVISTLICRDRNSVTGLVFFSITFFGLVLIAQFFPDATVMNTLKRSVMKLFAIGLLAIAYSLPVQKLSAWLKKWQEGKSRATPINQ